MTNKLSIVISAYNKPNVLVPIINSINTELTACQLDWEVIVMTDEQKHQFNKQLANDKIKIYDYPDSMPNINKLAYAFSKTTGDRICFLESNLDLAALNIRTLLAHMDQDSADIAIGSRFHHQSQPVSLGLLLSGYTYQFLLRFLFNLNIKDQNIKILAFKRPVLEKILPKIAAKDNQTQLELLVCAKHFGFSKISHAPLFSHQGTKNNLGPKEGWQFTTSALSVFARSALVRSYDQAPLTTEKLLIRSQQLAAN